MRKSVKRLQFLEVMLKSCGKTKIELAEMMGVSPQNIHVYFKRDDMKLSTAQKMAECLGYNLVFSFQGKSEQASKMILDIEPMKGPNGVIRLTFLQIAMSVYQIDKRELSEKLGISYTGVLRWFKVDDISLSYIFQIAELYELDVRVRADKIKYSPDSITLI